MQISKKWKLAKIALKTLGTETSQYLQEKKSIEILVVVASESGISLNNFYVFFNLP